MKINNIEGSPKEIKDFCIRFELDIKDLIEEPKKEVSKLWIIIPSIIFIVFSLFIYPCSNTPLKIVLIVLGVSLSGCSAFVIQLKYNNTTATLIFCVVCCLILEICTRSISLKKSLEKINAITLDKYKEMAPSQKNP